VRPGAGACAPGACIAGLSAAQQWIRTYAGQHPIAVSAWMFLLLSRIQPFEEGNMRVASLVASIPLMRHKIPPVLVPKSLRKEYNDALHQARMFTCVARLADVCAPGLGGQSVAVRGVRAQELEDGCGGGGEHVRDGVLHVATIWKHGNKHSSQS
jgi:hypothetical protein